MANIKVTLDYTIVNGQPLTFKSPVDCSQVTGLVVYYPIGDTTTSRVFQFADAHGNNVGDIDLFASNVLVKVVLDLDASRAYVQNADTNAYLEGRFEDLVKGDWKLAARMDGNLVENGNGYMGDNTNFTKLNFDATQSNNSYGSFVTPSANVLTEVLTARVPIDSAKKYTFSIDAKTLNGVAVCYLAFACYNSAGTYLGLTAYKAMNATRPPSSWTTYTAEVLSSDFKEGTASVALRFNLNYNKNDDLVWITNVSFKEEGNSEFDPTNLTAPVPIEKGGTGATTAEGALYNLGAAPTYHYHDAAWINSGVFPIARGGTGASDAATARTNLGVAPAYTYSTTDLTAGTTPLETGKLHFVYE